MNENDPLNVVLLGFDDRSRDTIQLIFQRPGKGCCQLTDEQQAEAGIINLDSVDGHTIWENFQQRYPQRPAIVMAVKNPGISNAIFLSKPVRQDGLLSAVQQLAKEQRNPNTAKAVEKLIQALPTKQAPLTSEIPIAPRKPSTERAIDKLMQALPVEHTPSSPRKSPTIDNSVGEQDFYDPQQFLQGELLTVLNTNLRKEATVKLEIAYSDTVHKIFLMSSLNRVVHKISDEQLAQLCSTPAFLLKLKVRHYRPKEALDLELNAQTKGLGESVEVFLWKVARLTSNGRLPVGMESSASVYLSHWPNFTRLPSTENAMRIAALLTEQPRPLPLVAKVLNIPKRDVFSFYCACHAIGLAGVSQRSIDNIIQTEVPSPPRQHGLFGRLLNRLKDIGNTAA